MTIKKLANKIADVLKPVIKNVIRVNIDDMKQAVQGLDNRITVLDNKLIDYDNPKTKRLEVAYRVTIGLNELDNEEALERLMVIILSTRGDLLEITPVSINSIEEDVDSAIEELQDDYIVRSLRHKGAYRDLKRYVRDLIEEQEVKHLGVLKELIEHIARHFILYNNVPNMLQVISEIPPFYRKELADKIIEYIHSYKNTFKKPIYMRERLALDAVLNELKDLVEV